MTADFLKFEEPSWFEPHTLGIIKMHWNYVDRTLTAAQHILKLLEKTTLVYLNIQKFT